jgi:hypothetical protein
MLSGCAENAQNAQVKGGRHTRAHQGPATVDKKCRKYFGIFSGRVYGCVGQVRVAIETIRALKQWPNFWL